MKLPILSFSTLALGLLVFTAGCGSPELPLPSDDESSAQARAARREIGGRVPRRLTALPPQAFNQIAHWPFDGSANEAGGRFSTRFAQNSYSTDRFGTPTRAALFNGVTDIVEIADGIRLITPANTVSFWMKLDTTVTHGHFIMGANCFFAQFAEVGATGGMIKQAASFRSTADTAVANDIYYIGSNTDAAHGGWQASSYMADIGGTTGMKQRLASGWAQVVFSYEPAMRLRKLYINGQKMAEQNFNLLPNNNTFSRVVGAWGRTETGSGIAGELSSTYAFGFNKGRDASFWSDTDFGDYAKPGANHFKGALDDVRFWNVALTDAEVTTLYNQERN